MMAFMPNVVRFALSEARDLYIDGVGSFRAGILDVDANNLRAIERARYLVQPYRAVEIGIVSSTTPKPNLPVPAGPPAPNTDPYPQYLTDAEAAAQLAAGTGVVGSAARGAFGRAAPVLSDFVYDATGNLLSYKEDGIPIVLTYNADGTVATSKRGTEPTQTFAYSGGNLAGVA